MSHKNLGSLISEWVKVRQGEPFAFFSHESHINGVDLDLASGRLANKLTQMGLMCGSKVVLVFKPCKELLISLMACWRLGIIVAPIDRFISPAHLNHILSTFAPELFIIDSTLENASKLEEVATKLNCAVISFFHEDLKGSSLPPLAFPDSDIALCLFTSGSTGLPKGVLLSHEALLSGARNVLTAFQVGSDDRVLCVLPLSHLNGLVTTFITPLLSFGSVVYMQDSFTAGLALNLIDEYSCTWFSAVPTHYMMMVSPPVDMDGWSLDSLKFCRSASAPLSKNVIGKFENHYGIPLIETMGTTETAGQIFSNPLPPSQRKPGFVGFPVGFDVRLMNEDSVVLKPGEQGEIQVRGPAMMAGYLDDPQETQKAFAQDWFRTGDIGVFDAEGYYSIKGRSKEIAIFCGLNISLRAIEMAVFEAEIVKDAACKGVSHPIFGETIIMYALVGHGEIDFSDVSRLLRNKSSEFLPNAQALTEVRFVDKFPRSSTGKVLKGYLEDQKVIYSSQEHSETDPRALLASVFNIPESSIDEDMMMGDIAEWDSLGYVSLIAATETVLGRELDAHETGKLMSFKGLKAVLDGTLSTFYSKGRKSKSKPVKDVVAKLTDAGFGSCKTSYLIMGFDHCAKLGVVDVEELLDHLEGAIDPDKNLVLNTFTWKFCKGESYHHWYSRCEVGLLNELFRKRKNVIRVNHPIYSYAILGPDSDALARHECETCWGDGSVTKRLLEDPHVHVTTFGLDELRGSLLRANPGFHALEEMFQVPYRYFKPFKGQVNFGNGFDAYSTMMYVRPLQVTVRTSWRIIAGIMADRRLSNIDKENIVYSYMNKDLMNVGSEVLSEDNALLLEDREVLNHPLFKAELVEWKKK